jgi:hypothetical protein
MVMNILVVSSIRFLFFKAPGEDSEGSRRQLTLRTL